VTVYVPASDPGPLSPNLVCDQCTATLPGGALAATQTDEAGHFELDDVPATGDVPVVIQVGKWRRQLRIPNVAACQDLPVALADTSLPKSYKDASPLTDVDATGAPKVDMPKIAISTGDADALECLPLKLGVDPSEITNDVGPGHVHLYTNKDSGGQGTNKFTTNWPGSVDPNGDAFGDAETMWGNNAPTTPDHLASYDIVMFSCEGGQFPATKKQSSLDAVKAYADAGGRVFMSHWHNIWISGTDPSQQGSNQAVGIPSWQGIATWNFPAAQNDPNQLAVIDETVPKGKSFAEWMVNVGGSTVRDQVVVNAPRYTLQAQVDPTKSERMVWVDPAQEYPDCASNPQPCSNPFGETSVQDLEFLTPVENPDDQKCGKVVFSDMHVASGSVSATNKPFPTGCSTTPLSPQEKALSFIFFDIASCVGVIQ